MRETLGPYMVKKTGSLYIRLSGASHNWTMKVPTVSRLWTQFHNNIIGSTPAQKAAPILFLLDTKRLLKGDIREAREARWWGLTAEGKSPRKKVPNVAKRCALDVPWLAACSVGNCSRYILRDSVFPPGLDWHQDGHVTYLTHLTTHSAGKPSFTAKPPATKNTVHSEFYTFTLFHTSGKNI